MNIKKSFLAGALIGFGGLVNITVGGWLGALLFATGLLTICINGYQLVTGRFEMMYNGELPIDDIIFMFLYNILGATPIAFCRILSGNYEQIYLTARNLCEGHLAQPWFAHIFLGILCGICIQIAVQNFKKGSEIGVILPVMVFILTGSQHCIAESVYFFMAGIFSWQAVLEIVLVFIGNCFGAVAVVWCNGDSSFHPHFL